MTKKAESVIADNYTNACDHHCCSSTWVVPAGRYDTVTYSENSFLVTTDSNSVSLPFCQTHAGQPAIHITRKNLHRGNTKARCHTWQRFIASKKIT